MIEVQPEDAAILDRPNGASWRIGLCWPELRKGVEYLGKQHETTPRADRERLNSLVSKRWSILQYEYRHLVDARGRARRVEQIRRLLGMKAREDTPGEVKAQDALEQELFGPARFRL